jgi:hypothetical protein
MCRPLMGPRLLFAPCHVSTLSTCSHGLISGGIPRALGVQKFREFGMLGCWDVGVNLAKGPDPLVSASAFNVLPRVSVDPSGVQEFKTLEVWSVVIG